jgi:hypothetical protein
MLVALLFSISAALAQSPPAIEELSFPCLRVFSLANGRESARTGHFENSFPWTYFDDGGMILGRELRVDYVKVDGSIVEAWMQLYRARAAYKIFLTRKPVAADFAVYSNPFLHGLPDSDRLRPLLIGRFHVFVGEDVSFVVAENLEQIGICPRATMDWHDVRAVLFRFMTDLRIISYLNCGNFLMGKPPRG